MADPNLAHPALIVQIHLSAAIVSLVLGAWQLIAARGGVRHRVVGRVFDREFREYVPAKIADFSGDDDE